MIIIKQNKKGRGKQQQQPRQVGIWISHLPQSHNGIALLVLQYTMYTIVYNHNKMR